MPSWYVVLLPHSNTNHTDHYRVVEGNAWLAHYDKTPRENFEGGESFKTLAQAEVHKDYLNTGGM